LTVAKVGGLVVYSTCSFNPLENEAVVTEAIRRAGEDNVELLDIHSMYPGILEFFFKKLI
jgi:16S rRNA C967 or C1407 C5-methylase (RsmB/RsmF family)